MTSSGYITQTEMGRHVLLTLEIDNLLTLRGLDVAVTIFFFFQAEDGIRDLTVTGVQTCALPILTFNFLWLFRLSTFNFLSFNFWLFAFLLLAYSLSNFLLLFCLPLFTFYFYF